MSKEVNIESKDAKPEGRAKRVSPTVLQQDAIRFLSEGAIQAALIVTNMAGVRIITANGMDVPLLPDLDYIVLGVPHSIGAPPQVAVIGLSDE